MPPGQFNETVKLYNRLGWRVFTHAVGDAAIDEVLSGYEAANAEASIRRQTLGSSSTRSSGALTICRA